MNTDTDQLNPGVTLQDQNNSTDQFLTFMLGDEEYAVDILNVQEIRSWEPATPILNAPEYLLGVINLRGVVIPVVDMRKKFAMSRADYEPTTIIVVVNISGHLNSTRTVGMVVDAVSDVYNIAAEDIKEMPDVGSIVATEFISGVASANEKMVIILNIELLINTGVLGTELMPESDEARAGLAGQ